ncbi:uncharacterized protein LOC119688217 [Teleopsis dalmanni]|uniref:uncharacterized protein LOC119688217 n=1 Tax=Teleopsis dalmanni TaxID=139649 RepID=UPI0018CFBD3F|nr:uncharacterized protein LOC119688217 [Teleopsis dalmanni]
MTRKHSDETEMASTKLRPPLIMQLKNALLTAPVLKLFDPSAYTEIHTDASMYGYGAVLLPRDKNDNQLHHVQFMSHKMQAHQQKYHSYELEVLALEEALKKWRIYVLGTKFKITTD